MTQAEFDKLPGLMTAKVFMQVTGLTKGKLREMRQAKSLYYVRMPGWKILHVLEGRRGRFYVQLTHPV